MSEPPRLPDLTRRLEADRAEVLRPTWREDVESGDAGQLDFAELRETARRMLAAREG